MEYAKLQRACNEWKPPPKLKSYCNIGTNGEEIHVRMQYPAALDNVEAQKALRESLGVIMDKYALVQYIPLSIQSDTGRYYTVVLRPR